MKIISFLIIFLATSVIAFPQNFNKDIVYLKNGNIVKGIIFEQIPGHLLRMYTTGGDTSEYRTEEIYKLERESILIPDIPTIVRPWQRAGYEGVVEMGISYDNPPEAFTACLKLNIINGYRFDRHIFIGGGIGVRYPYIKNDASYEYARISPAFNDFGIPVFIDIRTHFFGYNTIPYLEFSYGYTFDSGNNNPTKRADRYSLNDISGVGVFFAISSGISIISSDKYSVNAGLGLEIQKTRDYAGWMFNTADTEIISSSHCLSLNFGLSF
jgi:hypothetical protein